MADQVASPTILVTGASGFLGSAIVRQLRAQRFRLRTSGRRILPTENLPNYMALDLRLPSSAGKLVEGINVVIHAAGLAHQHTPGRSLSNEFFRVNTAGTETMVRAAAAAGCRRFVLVSSVSVYGDGSPTKTEIDPCFPTSPYAQSKLKAEQVATELAASFSMELIVLRMATLYGENDPGNVGRLLQAIDRRRFFWIGSGKNYKSLVHVQDAANACTLAATRQPSTHVRTFNVAAQSCTMHAIVSTLACALGRRPPSLYIPARIPLTAAAIGSKIPGLANPAQRICSTLDKWLSDETFDATLFRDAFGWRPEISLESGLARQVAHFRKNGQQPSLASPAIHDRLDESRGSRAA
jgi:nucleoside-diphosphate-sugar epimerase